MNFVGGVFLIVLAIILLFVAFAWRIDPDTISDFKLRMALRNNPRVRNQAIVITLVFKFVFLCIGVAFAVAGIKLIF